jgi:hypothetical protein
VARRFPTTFTMGSAAANVNTPKVASAPKASAPNFNCGIGKRLGVLQAAFAYAELLPFQ